jgi:2-oxoglutarate ferredoxin oxidoreductase subunit beta
MLARFFDDPRQAEYLPRPFGVLYAEERVCYEDQLIAQLNEAIEQKGEGDLNELIAGSVTWEI